MLQKVPLHIASTEANLKEAIRKSAPTPILASAGSTSGSIKRKLSKNVDQHSPSPSVTKRRRTQVDAGCTAQQQLPSPKSTLDPLFSQGGLATVNYHRSVGDALRSVSRSVSRPSNTAKTPNPGQRSSMQPPTPRIVPTTPSRMHAVALLVGPAQPGPSSLFHKKPRASNTSASPYPARPVSDARPVAPAPPNPHNRPKDPFKASNPFNTHTPLRPGSKQPNNWSTTPSTPAQPSTGFSAVRRRLTLEALSPTLTTSFLFFLSHSDEEDASFPSPRTMMMMKLQMIDAHQITVSPDHSFCRLPSAFPRFPSVRSCVLLTEVLQSCLLQIHPHHDSRYRRLVECTARSRCNLLSPERQVNCGTTVAMDPN